MELNLPYLPAPVEGTYTRSLYFPSMDKLVFLSRFLYMKIGPPHYYYGTLTLPLGEEFQEVLEVGVEFERRLLWALSDMGIVQGIAAPWPLADSRWDWEEF